MLGIHNAKMQTNNFSYRDILDKTIEMEKKYFKSYCVIITPGVKLLPV